MSNLTMDYRILDRDAARFSDMLRSAREWELKLFVPDIKSKAALDAQFKELKNRAAAISAPDPVTTLLKSHINDFLDNHAAVLDAQFDRPMKHITLFTQTMSFAIRKDARQDEDRAEVVVRRFAQADDVWNGVKTWLSDVSALYLQEGIDSCRVFIETVDTEKTRFDVYFPRLSENGKNRLKAAMEELQAKMTQWMEDMGGVLAQKGAPSAGASDDDIIKFEESYYRRVLSEELGVSLDELLSWHEEEIKKTREAVFETMGKINVSDPFPKTMGEINDILLKYAGPANTPDEMFERAVGYLKRTSEAVHDYVWLPEEKCVFRNVPEQLKVSYPWGGCGGGDPRGRDPFVGEMFLNGYNFKAVTDGWMKMNTVHEAYPGHHVQFVRGAIDKTPETVKMGAKYVPILEGLCHRSEKMFEFVFPEDPFYPLFVAYRRHHTSVRIKVDLWLRYFGRPIKDGVQLYMDELGFDHHIARGQVKAQESMQGYFTCYYYGFKKLDQWEKEYKLEKKAYTEDIVSAGKISLDNFHSYLKLTDEQKRSFTHDYASLLQFDENGAEHPDFALYNSPQLNSPINKK